MPSSFRSTPASLFLSLLLLFVLGLIKTEFLQTDLLTLQHYITYDKVSCWDFLLHLLVRVHLIVFV